MLSTGVDIPALEFIVFLRPVKSRILWEQMLGRGTRRCHDINKSKFVVFDCFDGTLIQYFKDVSSFEIEPPRADAADASRRSSRTSGRTWTAITTSTCWRSACCGSTRT